MAAALSERRKRCSVYKRTCTVVWEYRRLPLMAIRCTIYACLAQAEDSCGTKSIMRQNHLSSCIQFAPTSLTRQTLTLALSNNESHYSLAGCHKRPCKRTSRAAQHKSSEEKRSEDESTRKKFDVNNPTWLHLCRPLFKAVAKYAKCNAGSRCREQYRKREAPPILRE